MAADSSNTILWHFIHYSDFNYRYCSCNFDRCTDWNSDSGIYHGSSQQKAGSNCSASGRTTGCDSVCNLRIVGAYGFKSIDVPFGKAGICRQHHPSVYGWIESAFCDYCAGNYDSANRDKHQCFFDPCSTRTFKVGFSCTWGNTYPDDI